MRPIYSAQLDRPRPVPILTRELVGPHPTNVTVAPATTTARGLSTEVPVGAANGLNQPSIVSCDNIQTIPLSDVGRHVGCLVASQGSVLADAIGNAFDLDRVVP
ncbi:MAG TPA: type II toxin-antitoxin system PemK/MazF family toxin [Mycobacterium sp.]|nr:type II toxin-antitoxin system PemK/MazF family toxin [Mycobacterium sp.]